MLRLKSVLIDEVHNLQAGESFHNGPIHPILQNKILLHYEIHNCDITSLYADIMTILNILVELIY